MVTRSHRNSAHLKTAIKRIGIDEVHQRRKEFVFLDCRSATALKRNPLQVRGALHTPEKDIVKSMKSLPRSRKLVTYCT
jgi:rhodanese-related sulfurtransferase